MTQKLSSLDSISAQLEERLSALNEDETLLPSNKELRSGNRKRVYTRDIKIKVYKLQEVGFNEALFDKL